MKKQFLYAMMAALMSLSTMMSACTEDEEEPQPQEKENEQQEEKKPITDENGNAAVIKIRVLDYEEGIEEYTDENGDVQSYEYSYPFDLAGKTVYMFDTEDYVDKNKAIKKAITDFDGMATFELTEDDFKESSPAFYFVIYDDNKVVGYGGLNIKKGKEAVMAIDTKGQTSGAIISNLVKTFKLVPLIKETQFNVHSRTNIGSDNQHSIELPENTIEWYYAFSCVAIENKNTPLGFIAAVSSYFDPTKGLASEALKNFAAPSGYEDCNVILYDESGMICNSRMNLMQGVVDEKKNVSGTYSLNFENPALTQGISVNFEAFAIIWE